MIIKKFQANTESEAIMLAKEELGKDAIVMNVKAVQGKGILKLFKKKTVEVTAAIDENVTYQGRENVLPKSHAEKPARVADYVKEGTEDSSAIEKKLDDLRVILEKQMSDNPEPRENTADADSTRDKDFAPAPDRSLECVQLIYNQLVNNEVDEKYANQVIGEIEPTLKKDASVDNVLGAIYQKIVLKLGKTEALEVQPGKLKFVFFIGPTGVGKTTTIAKLASKLKVELKKNVAFLTADTYRIAAVEQLRTYADILGIPMRVIYTPDELKEARDEYKKYDIVLVDTAGRSHRSRDQRDDIESLISVLPEDEREVYLVLSATTKYRDLVRITEAYSEISKYNLIFTKLDETSCIGNIFNIKMLTGAPLSYCTFGQNVPEDICKIDAQHIAKKLLGGND